MPKDFLTLEDWSPPALLEILARAAELKALWRKGERPQTLASRTLAMYFEHPSLRTPIGEPIFVQLDPDKCVALKAA